MSLFDVLRYPISSPPTEEELLAIPRAIYRDWVMHSDWINVGQDAFNRKHVADWYAIAWKSFMGTQDTHVQELHQESLRDIETLRRLIREYQL